MFLEDGELIVDSELRKKGEPEFINEDDWYLKDGMCGKLNKKFNFYCNKKMNHSGPHIAFRGFTAGKVEEQLVVWFSEGFESLVYKAVNSVKQ